MNEFGHIADDLTSLEMRVERMLGRAHAKALKAALQRAFVEACKASRAQRLEEEGRAPIPNSQNNGAPSANGAQNGRKASSGRSAIQKKQSSVVLRSAEMGA